MTDSEYPLPDCVTCGESGHYQRFAYRVEKELVDVRADRPEWERATIHAKHQRDRAIRKVNSLTHESTPFWHPDDEGPYT